MTDAPQFMVEQEGFRGTLGELAHALRSGNLAPSALDLKQLVQDYLEHFEALAATSLDVASEALPRVAQLIELKLRLLLPRPPREEGEEEALVEALGAIAVLEELDEAVDFLRRRRDGRRLVLPARTPRPEYPRKERPLGIGPDRLAELAARFRNYAYFELMGETLTLAAAAQRLLAALGRAGRATLGRVAGGEDWRTRAVMFAALLELVREGRIRARQERPFGEIEFEAAEAGASRVA